MVTAVIGIGIGIRNTEVGTIEKRNGFETDIDPSIVNKLISENCFLSAEGFDYKERDSAFAMKSNSRASSQTSTTEVFVDGDGEEESDEKGEIADSADSNSNVVSSPTQLQSTNVDPINSRRIRFSTLTIREYPRVLGDNVTVMGPPISISWIHQDEKVYGIEEYEETIQDSRRTQSELKMPSAHRQKLLKDDGYSRKDIQEATKMSTIARNRRKRTVETLKLQRLHESIEKVVKIAKKPLQLTKKKSSLNLLNGRNN